MVLTYVSPAWVDVPPGAVAPSGTPAMDAANLQLLTDAVATLVDGIGKGGLTATGVKTAPYTAGAGELVPVNATSGSVTVTLPAAPADKTLIAVKLIAVTGANTVTVARGGTIDVFNKTGGSTSLSLSLANQAMVVQYDAATAIWYVIDDSLSLGALTTLLTATYVQSPSSGSNGQVLTKDSTVTPQGVKWAAGVSGQAALVPTAVKTANYTAAAQDLVPVDTTAGGVTVTLPSAPGDGSRVTVKHVIQGGTNVVTVACAGSDVFNKTGGSTSMTLPLAAQSIELQYKATGAIWYVAAGDLPLSALTALLIPDPLTVGEATLPAGRDDATSASVTLTSQQLRLTYFTARKTETITQVRLLAGVTAAAATPTLIRAGIYSVNPSTGDLALLAATASDTAIFAAANTRYTRSLTSSLAKVAGTRYALGMLVVSAAAMPTLIGKLTVAGALPLESAELPRICALLSGQADLPSTVTDASLTSTASTQYAVLLP